MNKTALLLLALTLLFIGLVGCGNTGNEIKQADQIELDANNIVSINLIERKQPMATISDTSSFERFVQAITTAEYDRGQLDIAPSDYRTTVNMKDGISYEFSFWIVGSNNGLLIKSGQMGHYRLSDTSKKDLLDLFQSTFNEDKNSSEDTVNPQPPSVQVTVGGEQFEAIQGSYCWNDNGKGVCVDIASNVELVSIQKVHPKAISGDQVELEFSYAPKEMEVMASFPGEERPDEALSVDKNSFQLAAGSGRHLYIIHARWPQGSASYVFEVQCSVSKK
ncbi:hypothetical protein NYE59_10065 [Paenibacillus sp. FSL L8-0323]|uniref:hypothetical protein n=1 Tax=Paenibacillus TaxID=44249 RepID=UPI00096DE34D|nr:hypothetical protein [Paenibacillus odorifer]OMD10643.1 hypothetical protein BJP47_27795 [Paenibacillus odorifer]OMD23963.1 hypothetical protein BJP48_06955 [Paenibacillus odorifer]